MTYNNFKFERRDLEREAEYETKHLADCNEVKTYKLTPDEIEKRYGACKGSGKKIGSLINVRNLKKKDDDEMAKIYDANEVIEAVKNFMEEVGITEHVPAWSAMSKKLKKYEKTIYGPIGGMTGLADKLGVPTLHEYKNIQKAAANLEILRSRMIKPIKDVSEERFEEEIAAVHPVPEVMTVTADAPLELSATPEVNNDLNVAEKSLREVIETIGVHVDKEELQASMEAEKKTACDQKVFDAYAHKVADYQKLSLNIDDCLRIEKELLQRQEELNIWLEGFEKAAELMGVDLG